MTLRQTVPTWLTLAAFAAAAAPARGQAFPDRARTMIRERVEAARIGLYQQGREEQTERQTRKLKLGTSGELSIANISGDVVVARGAGGDATVEIVKTARARTADGAREMLGLVEIAITERSGRAEVKTVYPQGNAMSRYNRHNVNVSVAYTISAPAGTRVTIGTVSGGITVTDIKGEITANAISGAVRIANAGRIASVRSVSGDVEIIDTQTDGGIEVQSVSGSVVVRNVTAHRMDLGSVSGGVVIHDVKCERIGAHTISGSVDFAGALTRNGRYELSSHSGDVRLAVAGDTGFEVQAASFSGSVRSDVPITIQGNDLAGGRGRRHSMRGVFGDGSAVLDLRTFSGSIAISKR